MQTKRFLGYAAICSIATGLEQVFISFWIKLYHGNDKALLLFRSWQNVYIMCFYAVWKKAKSDLKQYVWKEYRDFWDKDMFCFNNFTTSKH